jgi:hypothetical protein
MNSRGLHYYYKLIYSLPYFAAFIKGSSLATSLHKHGPPNSTFWILSIQDKEFNTTEAAAFYIKSLQHPSTPTLILFILVCHPSSTCTTYADNRAIFNQMKLFYRSLSSDQPTSVP